MMTSPISLQNYAFNSKESTYAIYYERPEITQLIYDEYLRSSLTTVDGTSGTIIQMKIEPLYDYFCPDPICSYKVKLNISSTSKGKPVNYNEQYEDDM